MDGLSLYLYVKGNPFLFRDPTGLGAVGDWASNTWEGTKSIAALDPGGMRTAWSTMSIEDRSESVRRRASEHSQNATSDSSIDEELAKRQSIGSQFGRRMASVGNALEIATRTAAQFGDTVDATFDFVDDPSWEKGTMVAMALIPGGKLAKTEARAVNTLRADFRAGMEGVVGRSLKSTERAHHIVPLTAKAAKEARAQLEKFGIDVNDAASNGALLADKFHGKLHTNAYYQHINAGLAGAKNADAARKFLADTRSTLGSAKNVDSLPWEKAARESSQSCSK